MLRQLVPADLEAITEICQLGMPYDRFFPQLVKEKTLDATDYDSMLSVVEEQSGRIRGFVQGAFGQRSGVPHGWIRLLVVHPSFRNQGIGSLLLQEIESRLRAKGTRKISTMDSVPNYLTPGIDFRYTEAYCFFEKHGYQKVRENMNLICDLEPDQFDVSADVKRLARQGFQIKRAEAGDKDNVLTFLGAEFPAWVGEVLECYKNHPISLYICYHQGKVVGFSAYDGNNRNTGWFGPMGVLPVTRGRGIGRIVCQLCLAEIARQGHVRSIIPWVGPVRFYSKVCNSRIDRIFWVYEREFPQ
jgi:mycothiol synthase